MTRYAVADRTEVQARRGGGQARVSNDWLKHGCFAQLRDVMPPP
jgi:hypothetical protein